MAKQKYTLFDDNGNDVGFVVVEVSPPTFQSVSNSQFARSDAAHDAALFLVVLAGFTLTPVVAGADGWLAATIGLSLTAGLAAIRAWRSGVTPDDAPQPNEVTLKLESWDKDENTVYLDEVVDKSITLGDWRKVAMAIVQDNRNFSRPALSDYVSQPTYHKIKAEMVRMNMAHRKGNNYLLSPRGVAFFRKIHSLPY